VSTDVESIDTVSPEDAVSRLGSEDTLGGPCTEESSVEDQDERTRLSRNSDLETGSAGWPAMGERIVNKPPNGTQFTSKL